MTNDEIREQLELALENIDCHTPEANLEILFLALCPDRIIRFKELELVNKFYANLSSWRGSGHRDVIIGIDLESVTFPTGDDGVAFKKVGGKRAREYERKYKGKT